MSSDFEGGFLGMDLTAVPDAVLVDDGEHKINCEAAKVRPSKKGDPMIELRYSFPDTPEASDLYHYIMLPTEADDARQKLQKQRNLKTFAESHGLDLTAPNIEDAVGSVVWALIEKQAAGEFPASNRIKRFNKAA